MTKDIALIGFVKICLIFSSAAYSVEEENDRIMRNIDRAYGISENLRRWDDAIQIVYNPTDSPYDSDSSLTATDPMLNMLVNAGNVWERVSGITFSPIYENPNIEDDVETSCAQRDQLVPVNWVEAEGFKGRAGPLVCAYNYDKGRFEVTDGRVTLNNSSSWDTTSLNLNFDTDRALIHELGHLIGLGHSNQPKSNLYANPYNQLLFPMLDDIRATQVLYGKNNKFVDESSIALEWGVPQRNERNISIYTYPNQSYYKEPGLYYYNSNEEKWEVERGAQKKLLEEDLQNGYFYFFGWTDKISETDADKESKYTIYLTEESGIPLNMVSKMDKCGETKIINGRHWCRLYLNFPKPNKSLETNKYNYYVVKDRQIIFEGSIDIEYSDQYINHNPLSTIKVYPTNDINKISFNLQANDSASGNIYVKYYPPGRRNLDGDDYWDAYIKASVQSGRFVNTDIDFEGTGWHEFFAEVNDEEKRYGDESSDVVDGVCCAGDGFQTLSRILVHTPLKDYPIASYIVDTNNVYVDKPTENYLSAGKVIKIKDSSASNANIWFATASNNDWVSSSNPREFLSDDFINIVTKIDAEEFDIRSEIEFFIAIKSKTNDGVKLFYVNSDRTLSSWNGAVSRLEPVWTMKEADNLPAYRKSLGL